MARPPDPDRLVTIHAGPPWDVDLLAMKLREQGIESFVPDARTMTVDPFITGTGTLDWRLQVRLADAERATAIVDEARKGLHAEPDPAADAEAEAGTEEDEESAEEEVEGLARRTRWAAVFGVMVMGLTLPFAMLYGWFYLKACRAYGIRARAHGLTLAALGLSVCILVAYVLLWANILG